jgi:hypothetical protein
MRNPTDGGPAFPLPHGPKGYDGLSLRDYFAAQALAMTISSYVNLPDSAELLAKRCYLVADAMLTARLREAS